MLDTLTSKAAAACAPLFLAFSPASAPGLDELTFAPAPGAQVTKTFVNVFEYSMDDMSMLMNGEENPMMPSMEMDMTIASEVKVTDKYGAVEDGKIRRLARRYDKIGQAIDIEAATESAGQTESDTVNGTGTSELEGKEVLFDWDADAGEYKRRFAEGSTGDEELLEGLAEDMTLSALLPRRAVSVGDEWEIPLESLVDVLAPGGNLHLDVEMEGQETMPGPDPTMMADMRQIFGDMLEGEASGRYVRTDEVEGVRLAVIELEIEIDSAKDMSEMLEEMMGETVPENMEMNLDRCDVVFALATKGELVWNLDGGHLHSLSIEGESAISMEMVVSMDFGGNAMTLEMTMDMSGTILNTVETE